MGINYQPQLVNAGFLPPTTIATVVSKVFFWGVICIDQPKISWGNGSQLEEHNLSNRGWFWNETKGKCFQICKLGRAPSVLHVSSRRNKGWTLWWRLRRSSKGRMCHWIWWKMWSENQRRFTGSWHITGCCCEETMCHVAISVDLRDQVWRAVCTICLVMAYRAAMELGVASDITTCHWNCKKVHFRPCGEDTWPGKRPETACRLDKTSGRPWRQRHQTGSRNCRALRWKQRF